MAAAQAGAALAGGTLHSFFSNLQGSGVGALHTGRCASALCPQRHFAGPAYSSPHLTSGFPWTRVTQVSHAVLCMAARPLLFFSNKQPHAAQIY